MKVIVLIATLICGLNTAISQVSPSHPLKKSGDYRDYLARDTHYAWHIGASNNGRACLYRKPVIAKNETLLGSYHYFISEIVRSTFDPIQVTEASSYDQYLWLKDHVSVMNPLRPQAYWSSQSRNSNPYTSNSVKGFEGRIVGYYNHIDKEFSGTQINATVRIPKLKNGQTLQSYYEETIIPILELPTATDRTEAILNGNLKKVINPPYSSGNIGLFSSASIKKLKEHVGFVSSTYENFVAWADALLKGPGTEINEEIYRNCLHWMISNPKIVASSNFVDGIGPKTLTQTAGLRNLQYACGGIDINLENVTFEIPAIENNPELKTLVLLYMLGEPISNFKIYDTTQKSEIDGHFVSFIKVNGSNVNTHEFGVPYQQNDFEYIYQTQLKPKGIYKDEDCLNETYSDAFRGQQGESVSSTNNNANEVCTDNAGVVYPVCGITSSKFVCLKGHKNSEFGKNIFIINRNGWVSSANVNKYFDQIKSICPNLK
jgi:hypothetical protein